MSKLGPFRGVRHLVSYNAEDKINTSGRSRTVLSKSDVIEIFKLKHPKDTHGLERQTVSSEFVGKMFHVSPKTIRDIWCGRTWYRATYPLDPTREDFRERLSRQPGRPKGSKDSRPRSRKQEPIHSLNFSEPNFDGHFPDKVSCSSPRKCSSSTADQNLPSNLIVAASLCEIKTTEAANDSTSSVDANYPLYLSDDMVLYVHSLSSSAPEFLDCSELRRFIDPFHDDWQHW